MLRGLLAEIINFPDELARLYVNMDGLSAERHLIGKSSQGGQADC